MEVINMLKREFKGRDVQRMRNIITKDYSAKTSTQIGYTKKHIDHKEGDVWEEDGKKWTIKNGVKQTVTRFDELKKLISLPLTCPKCGNAMKSTTLNKKMWPIHGTCFDCVIVMETELKRQGKFDEYAQNLISRGVKTYIKDLEDALIDLSSDSNNDFVTEQGDVEKWTGKGIDTKKITTEIQKHIQELQDHINV
jgi:bacterioferritin-associated ferredoxin